MARIFIIYSHQDEAWKERVVRQLGVLAGEGLETWDDRRIAGGDAWLPAIEQAIATCDVALLLISADFLTSRFILGQEVPPLLQRREQQDIRVIPLILSPCQWQRVGWLQPIQARPKDGADLAGMSKRDAEAALSALAGEIADLPGQGPDSRSKADDPSTAVPPRPSGAGLEARVGRPPRIDLTHLPPGAEHFLGRAAELAALDAAWAQAGRTPILELTAPGGTGKTALAGLRAAGSQHHIPRGLLTRAGLLHCLDDPAGARTDLEEAGQIAARGGMRLFQADCHLTRARLFRDPAGLPQARALIEQCGYGRRLPELQDAEAALGAPAPLAPVD